MHVVSKRSLARRLSGLPLSIAHADGEALASLRAQIAGAATAIAMPLLPPFHVSDDDAYLVLPEDIAIELRDMFADGDVDLLREAMEEGVLVVGNMEKVGRGRMQLSIDDAQVAARALAEMPYADTIEVGRGVDPVAALNALPQCRNTVASALVDLAGFQSMARSDEHAGISWRPPPGRRDLAGVDPTYLWSRRLSDGRVGIEAALFCEYEEHILVLRPAAVRFALGRFALESAPA